MQKRVRQIVLLFEFGTLQGGERSMLAVVQWLRANTDGWRFAALAPPTGLLAEALAVAGIEHVPFCVRDERGERLPKEQVASSLATAVGPLRADLLHANSVAMGRLAGAAAPRLSLPTVAHLRDIVRLSRRAIENLNQNRMLIAVSQAARWFHVSQGVDERKVRVLYNGVDCDRFRPRPATGWLRRRLALGAEAFLIGTVGQICLRKGQDVLARAAPKVVDRVPTAHFILVGERYSRKPESREFERTLRESFKRAGLGDHLHELGYRQDVPQ
ncbi:MAG TPA: hypothetical protein EYP14_00665, partial [Planctomycetaceae bacterium]|nr:hypothetical protein [Planctomycetaceae bacterium]